MSTLLLVGLNHRSAPVAVREALHFAAEHTPEALHALAGEPAGGGPNGGGAPVCAPAGAVAPATGPAHRPAPTNTAMDAPAAGSFGRGAPACAPAGAVAPATGPAHRPAPTNTAMDAPAAGPAHRPAPTNTAAGASAAGPFGRGAPACAPAAGPAHRPAPTNTAADAPAAGPFGRVAPACAPAAGPAHRPAPTNTAADAPATEFVLLSTCNRTEIYAWSEDESVEQLRARINAFLAARAADAPEALAAHLYTHTGLDAARHLLAVACGLDSLVAGEDEILGQVKTAFALAQSAGSCGAILSALFRAAITTGKRARSETGLGCLRRSVATVVVDLAQELFPNLAQRTALLIGAGKISAMTARGLSAAGLRCILVANRTYGRAVKLAAAYGGQAVHFDALPEALAQADIVICSTGAPHIVLHAESVRAALAQRAGGGSGTDDPGGSGQASMLVVDLAVPRDADAAITALPGARLVDIDGLEVQAREHNPLAAEVRSCVEAIVEAEVEAFAGWLAERSKAGLIRRLQANADRICAEQVEKTARRLGKLDPDERRSLEAMAHAIAARLLHAPIDYVKHAGEDGDLRQIFGLD